MFYVDVQWNYESQNVYTYLQWRIWNLYLYTPLILDILDRTAFFSSAMYFNFVNTEVTSVSTGFVKSSW